MHPMIRAVDELARKLQERELPEGIHPGEIEDLLGGVLARIDERPEGGGINIDGIISQVGSWVNVYPADKGGPCCKFLLVFSLKSKRWRGHYKKKHLKFKDAIETIINHVNDPALCKGTTRYVLFVTDSWDPTAIEPWESLLRSMRVDVLLLGPSATSPVLI